MIKSANIPKSNDTTEDMYIDWELYHELELMYPSSVESQCEESDSLVFAKHRK